MSQRSCESYWCFPCRAHPSVDSFYCLSPASLTTYLQYHWSAIPSALQLEGQEQLYGYEINYEALVIDIY